MYKLTLRPLGFISIVVILGALFGCMSQFPGALITVPGWLVLVAVIVPALIAAFAFLAKGSISQKIKISALGMALGFLYGLLANIHFATTRILPSYEVLINEYLLGFIALGGTVTAIVLFALKPSDGEAVKKPATEVEIPDSAVKKPEEQTSARVSSTKIPAVQEPLKPAGSISSTNLKGILDNLAPEDDEATPEKPAKSGLAASLGAKSQPKAPEPAPAPAPQPTSPTTSSTSLESTQTAATAAANTTPAPTDSQNNLAAQKRATTGTGASSTATRLQAQKRKSTSTFTKLQALSASGTGGVREKPRESTGDEADSLKSILDRLDTKQDDFSAPDEVEMDSLFGQESLLSPPEVAESESSLLQPSKPTAPEPAKEPAKTVETPKPAATSPTTSTTSASAINAKPSSKQFDSNQGAKKGGEVPSLSSMLDSLDAAPVTKPSPSSTSPSAKAAPSPGTAGGAAKPVTPTSTPKPAPAPSSATARSGMTPTSTPKPSSTAAASSTPTSTPKPAQTPKADAVKPAAETKAPTPAPKPVEATKPVDAPKPIEAAKPAEAPKPVETKTVETPKPAEPVKSPEPTPEPIKIKEAPKLEAESLFESGLDKEIDDIFSNLVPAEAQKTVESKVEPTEEKSSTATVEAVTETVIETKEAPIVEKEGLFETQIDQELDDIFSNLVPKEAQKEVVSSKTETKAEAPKPVEKPVVEEKSAPVEEKKPAAVEEEKPAPEVVPEPIKAEAPKESGMFEESGLDRELDDIFSNLAPSEAQRSVTHETLARVRAADVTGDHPAMTPENLMRNRAQEEMSFAPPSETENIQAEAEAAQAEQVQTEESIPESSGEAKSNETLQPMPNLQATVEGLLSNLAASETTKVETESFAPPEAKEPSNGSGVASRVMDLLDSLESGQSQAALESVEAAESSSGDLVNDLFDTSTKEAAKASEPNDELLTETVVETSDKAEAEAETHEQQEKSPEVSPDAEVTPEVETVAEAVPEVEAVPEAEAASQAKATPEPEPTKADVVEEAVEPEAAESKTTEAEPVAATVAAEASESSVTSEEKAESEEKPESEVSKKTAKQLKEFGRLSSKQTSGDFATETAGTMKTIGKLLLEVQAVENIIKAGESGTIGSGLTTARVISAARGEGIKALLSKIDSYNGVDGSVIVGHDGLVIASTVGAGMDKDTLGALSVACLSTSNLGTKKLEIGKLRQMVLVTDAKTTVFTDVDVGILAVFLNNNDVGKIDGLLEAIHDTIHG